MHMPLFTPTGTAVLCFPASLSPRRQVSRIARQQVQRQYPQYADSPIIQA